MPVSVAQRRRRVGLAAAGSGRAATRLTRAERTVRISRGVVLLTGPEVLIRLCRPADSDRRALARFFLRLLGARQVAQGIALPAVPATAGAAVDTAHAVTSLTLASRTPRWRTGAAVDAAIAAAFAGSELRRRRLQRR